jgi:hypothetical protein
MKVSEKNKDKAEDKIFRKRSPSCVEERFYLTTKYLYFAAICNRKRFLEVPNGENYNARRSTRLLFVVEFQFIQFILSIFLF